MKTAAVTTTPVNTVAKATPIVEATGTAEQLKAELTKGLTSLLGSIETIGAASVDARNQLLKLVDLVQELRTEIIVQEPDPELLRKAKQFDALAATLGSLIK